MGDPCTTEKAQKREINKSPRFDAHQSLSRARLGGKPWIVLLPQIRFEVVLLFQHRLEIPSPQRSYAVFWRHFSKHTDNVATPKMMPALQGELKVNRGSQALQVR